MVIAIDGRYVNDHFPGVGRYVFHLLEGLARIHSGKLVVFWNPRLPNSRFDLERLASQGGFSLQRLDAVPLSLYEVVALPIAIRQEKIDLLHSPHSLGPWLKACPTVITVHDLIPLLYPSAIPSRWARLAYRIALRLALRNAQRVIVPSQATARDLASLAGVPSEIIRVIPEAADERFRPLDADAAKPIKERYRLPKRFLLYLGSNKPHKNLPTLIQAFARVTSESDVALVLAGLSDRRYGDGLQMVARLGLSERVQVLGTVAEEDLPALYNLASAFVFPSLYEGFGLPALEALACGTPVIASSAGALPEVLGDAALMVSPQDPRELTEAMLRLLTDGALRESMSRVGLRRAACFSWDRAATETAAVYREVLG